jgi:hypothetical protein
MDRCVRITREALNGYYVACGKAARNVVYQTVGPSHKYRLPLCKEHAAMEPAPIRRGRS